MAVDVYKYTSWILRLILQYWPKSSSRFPSPDVLKNLPRRSQRPEPTQHHVPKWNLGSMTRSWLVAGDPAAQPITACCAQISTLAPREALPLCSRELPGVHCQLGVLPILGLCVCVVFW